MQSSYSNNLCFTYPSIAPNPTTCQAAGHTSCCSASGNGCYVSGGGCWCDEVCRNYGNCCPDIDTTCPKRKWPTQSSVISEYILNNETINNYLSFALAETTCQAAGHNSCCTGSGCYVSASRCWCDHYCHRAGNCCPDISTTCPSGKPYAANTIVMGLSTIEAYTVVLFPDSKLAAPHSGLDRGEKLDWSGL